MENEAIKNQMINLHPSTSKLLSDILEKLVKEKLEEYGVHGVRITVSDVKLAVSGVRLGGKMIEENPVIGLETYVFMDASAFEQLKPETLFMDAIETMNQYFYKEEHK